MDVAVGQHSQSKQWKLLVSADLIYKNTTIMDKGEVN